MVTNPLIPVEERGLTPDEVEALDRRRRRGQLFLVISGQCLLVAVLLLIWTGQDLTYSPGWHRPMFFWNAITGGLGILFGLAGIQLRRGSNEFLSF